MDVPTRWEGCRNNEAVVRESKRVIVVFVNREMMFAFSFVLRPIVCPDNAQKVITSTRSSDILMQALVLHHDTVYAFKTQMLLNTSTYKDMGLAVIIVKYATY